MENIIWYLVGFGISILLVICLLYIIHILKSILGLDNENDDEDDNDSSAAYITMTGLM